MTGPEHAGQPMNDMEDREMTGVHDITIMGCGCLVGTPHPDLFTNGARLAWMQTHPDCARHTPTGLTGTNTYTAADEAVDD